MLGPGNTHAVCRHAQSFWFSDAALLGVMFCPIALYRSAELQYRSDPDRERQKSDHRVHEDTFRGIWKHL